MASEDTRLQRMSAALERITVDMGVYHPRALLLFGSLARHLAGSPGQRPPNDIDLLVVTNNFPATVRQTDYGVTIELHRFTPERIIGIAKSLRYDSRAIALAKLYGRVLVRQHSIDVIAAAMLLGPAYHRFGIEQIDIDGRTDPRDYSIHRILAGEPWWTRLCRYAADRRGPLKRLSDKLAGIDAFA